MSNGKVGDSTYIVDLKGWPESYMASLKMCSYIRCIYMTSIKRLSIFIQRLKSMLKLVKNKHLTFDLWQTNIWPLTLKDVLNLNMLHFKMCKYFRCTCMWNIKNQSPLVQKLWPMVKPEVWQIYLTFDLERWPWPLYASLKFGWLYELNTHARWQVSICIG